MSRPRSARPRYALAGRFTPRLRLRGLASLALATRRPGLPREKRAGGRSVSDHRECTDRDLNPMPDGRSLRSRCVRRGSNPFAPHFRRCSDKHRRAGPFLPAGQLTPGGLKGRGTLGEPGRSRRCAPRARESDALPVTQAARDRRSLGPLARQRRVRTPQGATRPRSAASPGSPSVPRPFSPPGFDWLPGRNGPARPCLSEHRHSTVAVR